VTKGIKEFEIAPSTAVMSTGIVVQTANEEQALEKAKRRWPLAAGWKATELAPRMTDEQEDELLEQADRDLALAMNAIARNEDEIAAVIWR
jgi:hypothetical protein